MRHRLSTLLLLLVLALVSAAEAKTPRTLHVRFPRTVLSAGANVEMCVFARLPVSPDATRLGGER